MGFISGTGQSVRRQFSDIWPITGVLYLHKRQQTSSLALDKPLFNFTKCEKPARLLTLQEEWGTRGRLEDLHENPRLLFSGCELTEKRLLILNRLAVELYIE